MRRRCRLSLKVNLYCPFECVLKAVFYMIQAKCLPKLAFDDSGALIMISFTNMQVHLENPARFKQDNYSKRLYIYNANTIKNCWFTAKRTTCLSQDPSTGNACHVRRSISGFKLHRADLGARRRSAHKNCTIFLPDMLE